MGVQGVLDSRGEMPHGILWMSMLAHPDFIYAIPYLIASAGCISILPVCQDLFSRAQLCAPHVRGRDLSLTKMTYAVHVMASVCPVK